MSPLDDIDRAILNRTQDDLPLVANPYADVAEELGLTEAELLSRLERMKQERIITRFGPFFDAAAMGGAFCLCAMAIPAAAPTIFASAIPAGHIVGLHLLGSAPLDTGGFMRDPRIREGAPHHPRPDQLLGLVGFPQPVSELPR